jgi:hypothetical protein
MIAILLFAIAGILNAFADTIETEISFRASIFKKLNPKFWCKAVSANHVPFIPFTKYRPDAWHIAKSLWIISLAGAAVSSMYFPIFTFLNSDSWNAFISLVILGIAWNVPFSLFYNRVFSKKVK